MTIANEHVLPEFQKYLAKLNKAQEHLKNELANVRAGRANPGILDKITVDYWGTPTKLRDMANITVPEARMLLIAPYDQSALKSVTKAIQESDIGINPTDDGKIIRLVFPQLNEERRKDLVKTVKKTVEDSKIVLRNERREIVEAIKKFKKDSLVTEDEVVLYEKEVQKELDKAVENLDKLFKSKEKEILEI
ncbi:MAG: ribosome recycling factor [Firmicutes bacterium]|nr:ribosome recycling factor [Bacillota bacterium]